MDTVYSQKNNCCGCSLCEYVCPKNAIKMVTDNGFVYPEIDNELCVDCKKCQKLCPIIKNCGQNAQQKCYAARHKDKSVINASSSGGVFTALSDYILNENGIIFGAAFTDEMKLVHTTAETSEERDKMRGSKYIQSNCTGIYAKIDSELAKNRPVLFCGTPCQVGAVRNAFPDRKNLYLADIICHGVPTPLVWEKFVDFIESKYGQKLSDYKFRNKENGWRTYSALAQFKNGKTMRENNFTGSYIELFRYDVCIRSSCTVCPYASTSRPGDITIGDFWGIENIFPDIDDNKGVSAVICNNEKGAKLLDSVKDSLELYQCDIGDISAKQPNMSKPSKPSVKAEAFIHDLNNMPFDSVLRKYTRVGIRQRTVDIAKKILRK